MYVHFTGEELYALVCCISNLCEKQIIKLITADDLWINISQNEKGEFKVYITDKVDCFKD